MIKILFYVEICDEKYKYISKKYSKYIIYTTYKNNIYITKDTNKVTKINEKNVLYKLVLSNKY